MLIAPVYVSLDRCYSSLHDLLMTTSHCPAKLPHIAYLLFSFISHFLGRRTFPGIVVSITGLEMEAKYSITMEVSPPDNHRYKFLDNKWVVVGKADAHSEELAKYAHPDGTATGKHWMANKVSFKKLKVTNNKNCKKGQVRASIPTKTIIKLSATNCSNYTIIMRVCLLDLYSASQKAVLVAVYKEDPVFCAIATY